MLTYSERGRSRTVMLDPGEVRAVTAAVERYRAARSRVEEAGNAGLEQLLAGRRPRRGR